MRNVFSRHLFLLIGLLSLCLFFLVTGLDRVDKRETGTMVGTLTPNHVTGQVSQTGAMRHALAGPIRVLIVPMYLVWMVIVIVRVAIVGAAALPGSLEAVIGGISLVAGVAPYAFADYVLARWRQTRATAPTLLGLD